MGGAGATGEERSMPQGGFQAWKLAPKGQKSMDLAVRFVGSHTSFSWKDDIRAEAMTWAGIPRLHCVESGSDNIKRVC